MSNGTVTIINTTPYEKKPVPTVGKEYHVFDDGKISPSRHYQVTIKEVIPFADAPAELVDTWRKDVEDCYWLYATETDYFAMADDPDDDEGPMYFVRTQDGGWFSIGFWGGRLDIDDRLYGIMLRRFEENN